MLEGLQIGPVEVVVLIVGIVQALKQFGVSGKGCQISALALGFLFAGLAQAIAQGLIPESVVVWIELVVFALAGSVAAMGMYDLGKSYIAKLRA